VLAAHERINQTTVIGCRNIALFVAWFTGCLADTSTLKIDAVYFFET
jgi:hypothetical protein